EIVKNKFTRSLKTDDVFQDAFTNNAYLIVQTPKGPGDASVSLDLADFLQSKAPTMLFTSEIALAKDPYFVLGRNLDESWRLYPDNLGTFAVATILDDTDSAAADGPKRFKKLLQDSTFTGGNGAVAMPSRLYAKPTEDEPRAGIRISIDDNVHPGGVITGLGSRAYAELYGTQPKMAEFVQLLIDKGAIVVEKTNHSGFAGSEIPPTQCIDYFPPWNPRGDRYQGPSGSSSGAGASAAGYDWLDISFATDSSVRYPATSHGLWGQRVTWGSLPIEGVVPACPQYDIFGLSARTPTIIINRVLAVGGIVPSPAHWPTKMLYSTEWFAIANKEQQQMDMEFLRVLENYFGLKHTKFSLENEWRRTGPEHLRKRTVADIEKLSRAVNRYENYHVFDDFRSEYRKTFGKSPYLSPSRAERWQEGAAITVESFNKGERIVNEFREWSPSQLFVGESEDSSAIMLVPHGRPGANYRDGGAPTEAPKEATGPLNQALPPRVPGSVFATSMVGAPRLVVPCTSHRFPLKLIAEGALEKAGWPPRRSKRVDSCLA
ncbi:amidase signature domain-containing protein, partial [Immersiella caudata]